MRMPSDKDSHVYRLAYENWLLDEKDIELILEYVSYELRYRFVMAEPIIRTDADAWERYCNYFNWTGEDSQ